MNGLQKWHKMVWDFRDEIRPYWPEPSTLDSLRFAVTEIGEAIDAKLRENEVYVRNHDRQMSVDKELSDCALMLLTAIPPNINPSTFPVILGTSSHPLDHLPLTIGDTLNNAANQALHLAYIASAHTVNEIAMMVDLETELTETIRRLKNRHIPAEE